MSTLTTANSQWANRAADERFSSLDAMHAKALANRQLAATAMDIRTADDFRTAFDTHNAAVEAAELITWSLDRLRFLMAVGAGQ